MDESLILEVSQVNSYIKEMLDADVLLNGLCIRGELSNYKTYPSGHHYFTLKDGESTLKCVMFRNNAMRLRFRPENGMTVLAAGRISVYPRDGVYQLYCVSMRPEGAGDLAIAFEQLKQKLSQEGLFDEEHKQPIPEFPEQIVLITSSAGAALHDMLRILGQRYPLAEVKLLPVRVQGTEAPGEIAEAIDYANRFALGDLIITGRGGGSMEDLWAFNEEIVARAIYNSKIPIISAVGHEPDVTIADYVADLRAATPSNGAELATPDQAELRVMLSSMESRIRQRCKEQLELARRQLSMRMESPALRFPVRILEQRQQNADQLTARLFRALDASIQTARGAYALREERLERAWSQADKERRQSLETLAVRLDAMSPLKVLSRGYSIAEFSGKPVREAKELKPGDKLTVRFSEGAVLTRVEHELEEP